MLLLFAAGACSDDAATSFDESASEPERGAGVPTMGSGIALAPDDSLAVAANRDAESISVFATDLGASPPVVTQRAEIKLAAGSQPWAAVVSNNGNQAYVLLRQARKLVRIAGLRGATPNVAETVGTGSEPTGIAISPSGKRLYVTNFVDGTVGVYAAPGLKKIATVDLNAALAGSGLLGQVASRPGLAHPRAIVITNNGDGRDEDETVYVTEFFAQRIPTVAIAADGSNADVNHEGVVYSFSASDMAVGPIIAIPPVADTGFQDALNQTAGCFPNQLFAMKVNHGRVYVSAACESPRGPTGPAGADVRNFRTEMLAVVAQIDTATRQVIPANTVVLHDRFSELFTMRATPTGEQRFPLIPIDIGFARDTSDAYVLSYGASSLFRVAFAADGSVAEVGPPAAQTNAPPVVRLNADAATTGLDPYGLAVANDAAHHVALVINENTRNVSVVNLDAQKVVAAVASTAPAPAEAARRGRHFFVTGLGRWSLDGQGWNSCEGCHPDGTTDNVTWYFPRGPRQSISLESTFSKKNIHDQRILNWTAIFDQAADFEVANVRGNSGGVGAMVHTVSNPLSNADRITLDVAGGTAPTGVRTVQAGLNGSATSLLAAGGFEGTRTVINDWAELETYIAGIRPLAGVSDLDAGQVSAGRQVFRTNCAGCHGGDKWTVSRVFYTPNEANNNLATGALRARDWTLPQGFPAAAAPAPGKFRPTPVAVAGGNDEITCVLRDVGTMPPAGVVETVSVFPHDEVELRQDMKTRGQGDATPQETGLNPPGLLGVAAGGPYFHAGNARTLEELLSPTFARHSGAFAAGALSAGEVKQLVAFMLSIDTSTATFSAGEIESVLGFNPDVCGAQSPAFE